MDDTQQPEVTEDSKLQVISTPDEQPQQQPAAPPGVVWKTPELAERFAKLQQLMAVNAQLEMELQETGRRYGGQAGIDPGSVMALRFQLLLDIIWPIDTEEGQSSRLLHDELFQRSITATLENAKQQVAMQALAMGSQIPPEQMAKMMKPQPPPGLQRAPERRTRK